MQAPRSAKKRRNSSLGTDGASSDAIKVICRFRKPIEDKYEAPCDPLLNQFDINSIYSLNTLDSSVEVAADMTEKKRFTFDKIFSPEANQADIFSAVDPIVGSILSGFNGTILAYGQTSAGKSYTMEGPSLFDEKYQGVTSRAIEKIFQRLKEINDDQLSEKWIPRIQMSYVEVYCERIRDLLNPQQDNMKLREIKPGIFAVQDVTEVICPDKETVFRTLELGKTNRALAPTLMNAESSRSHSLLVLNIALQNEKSGHVKHGRLTLVDLAGSEKVSKTGASSGLRLEEAKNINRSLTTLGMVINALHDGSSHIPYRDSKLTLLLSDSLGGNSKTCLILCVSPDHRHLPESVSTLRFGERAKKIRNKAHINEEYSVEELKLMLAEAKKEIQMLKANAESSRDESLESLLVAPLDSNPKLNLIATIESHREETEEGEKKASSAVVDKAMEEKTVLIEMLQRQIESLEIQKEVLGEEVSRLTAKVTLQEDEIEEERTRYDQEKAKKVDLSVENDVLKGAVIELEAKLLELTLSRTRSQSRSRGISSSSSSTKLAPNLSDSSSSILSVDNNKNLDGWIDPEEQESDESGKIVDYRLKYFKLKGDYEKHITQLMTRLSQEQQSKITLEERLEDALDRLNSKKEASKSSNYSSSFFSFLGPTIERRLSISMPSNREATLERSLEFSQAQVAELEEELRSTREANNIVLETKDSVLRQFIRQNSKLSTEREDFIRECDCLRSQIEHLTGLLKDLQHISPSITSNE